MIIVKQLEAFASDENQLIFISRSYKEYTCRMSKKDLADIILDKIDILTID
ncbi:MAG: hypothetical protein ACOC1O_03255 [bacterium]